MDLAPLIALARRCCLPMAVPRTWSVRVSLLAFLALLVLLVVPLDQARAWGTVQGVPGTADQWCMGAYCASDASAACQQWMAPPSGSCGTNCTFSKSILSMSDLSPSQKVCTVRTTTSGTNGSSTSDGGGIVARGTVPTVECPAGTDKVNGACVCAKGTKPNLAGGSSCQPIDCQAEMDFLGDTSQNPLITATPTTTACRAGCQVQGSVSGTTTGGQSMLWGAQWTGKFCEGSRASPSDRDGDSGTTKRPEDAQPLPPGKCPGTVNGTAVVVPCATKAAGNTQQTTKPDGTKVETETETKCVNGVCKTTTTTTETSPGGATTTTTSTTVGSHNPVDQSGAGGGGGGGGSGSGDGDGEGEEDEESFCAENPESMICVTSSFGGSCAGAFSCEGDAVQCAVAQEQHQRNCTLFEKQTPQSELGTEALTAGDRPGDHPANEEETVSLDLHTRLSTVPLFGSSGGCPADVMAGGYELRFSQMCGHLNILGAALMALAMLVSAFIVFGKGS